MSNVTSRYMEERENNLAMMRFVLELASDLGIDMVKVFAAWPGLVNDEEDVAMDAQYPGISLKRRTAASCRGRRRHLAARSITKRSSTRCRKLATPVISRPNTVWRW
jgi:hypothetical protein